MRRIENFRIEFNDAKPAESKNTKFLSFVYDVLDSVKSAAIVVFLVFALAFRAVGVEGPSMRPTLEDGDWVAVAGAVCRFKRGDVVVVNQPWKRNVPIIKRVVAVGGDEVYIDFDRGEVYVDGEKLDEPYISEPTRLEYDVKFPLSVDEGKLFVMGDNRNVSMDSRSSDVGLIDERYVLGKATARIFPFSKWNIYDYD